MTARSAKSSGSGIAAGSGYTIRNPRPWTPQSSLLFTLLSFLNTSKYPPSLLFLLMTLGPGFLFLAIAEKAKGKVVEAISVFGRVPFFFYLVHFYVLGITQAILQAKHGELVPTLNHTEPNPETPCSSPT